MKSSINHTRISHVIFGLLTVVTFMVSAAELTYGQDSQAPQEAASVAVDTEGALKALDSLVVALEAGHDDQDLAAKVAWVESLVKIGHHGPALAMLEQVAGQQDAGLEEFGVYFDAAHDLLADLAGHELQPSA